MINQYYTDDSLFIFVVDTNRYAGSFERPLTAFCTGCVGECEVGEEYAEVFKQDHPELVKTFQKIIAQVPDDHNCLRPAAIWTTPGYWNDGMGTEWPDAAWGAQETIEKYRHEVWKYKKQYPKALPEIDAQTAMPHRSPAYLSVAMFFAERPSDEILSFLCRRVLKYKPLDKFDGTFEVSGYRLLQTKTVRTETVLWQASHDVCRAVE